MFEPTQMDWCLDLGPTHIWCVYEENWWKNQVELRGVERTQEINVVVVA